MKRHLPTAAAAMLMLGAALGAHAFENHARDGALIVTATNASANQLLVYSASGALLKTLYTQGQGGVSGNAGGIAASRDQIAVVNFGSSNVSVFARDDDRRSFHLERVIATVGNPVSVAFGQDHLYVLTTTRVESHPVGPRGGVSATADGAAQLLHGDATAAQVGVTDGQLIITEKSNAIESVDLDRHGAIVGKAITATNIPSNIDTPFGLATRGNEAYVTLAHADEISLVRDGKVLTTTPSVTQHAPCWVALDGPFLFSANSPSMSVSRYAVYGQHLVQDAAVVAKFNGAPTDIDARAGLAAVIDSSGAVAHLSVFDVDQDGNLAMRGVATVNGKLNGVAIVADDDRH